VPITKNKSAAWVDATASAHTFCGSPSPNHTTPGRSIAPHEQNGGKDSSRGRKSLRSRSHTVHRTAQISPCTLRMFLLPARSCRPSTFCVTSVKLGTRRSISASAKWPALGCASAITLRRQSYHSHTNFGSRAKPCGVANSSARYVRHTPPGPRNVGMPLSADMPAPVSTATDFAARNQPATVSTLASTTACALWARE
jgi:hypothetical protein